MPKSARLRVLLAPPNTISAHILIIIVLTALNIGFSWFNNVVLKSPLFLDSLFTAVAAAVYGPVSGMAVGLLTNLGMEPVFGITGLYWPFAACNMATGLIVGLMASRGRFRRGFHVTLTILAVTLANALLGTIISYIVFDGDTGVQIDHIVAAFVHTGRSVYSANFWARIPTNLVDKMFAVYAAFAAYRWIDPEEQR